MAKPVSHLAGTRPNLSGLVTRERMRNLYYNPSGKLSPIKNGTSGHRGDTGSAFSDLHVAAMTQALVDIKRQRGTFGPDLPSELLERFTRNATNRVILGKDVRFTSDFAQRTAAEVFAGNGITVIIHKGERATPTPVVSHFILTKNAYGGEGLEGGIITASHNPPEQAGYKTNGLDGGPNTETKPIDNLANYYLDHPEKIKRMDYEEAKRKGLIIEIDLITPYVEDLAKVVRMDIIRTGRFAATPLGGAAHGYYEAINGMYGTKIEVVISDPDPSASNRTYDWDGKLRGDPSSKYVMKAVEGLRGKLGVPFIGANDNDADRFGGEDETAGILNPNHVLCVLFDYLARTRGYNSGMGVGRTIGTTHMLDLIAENYGRKAYEFNVGFKWYVRGLLTGRYVLAGEESAGLSFPRLNGETWVTEKDGIAAVLLMMEVIAQTGKDIGTLYGELVSKYGPFQYEREDSDTTPAVQSRLNELARNPELVKSLLSGKKIAGRSIVKVRTQDENGNPDGVKVELKGGVWVLKRVSGTEGLVLKDYREERGETLETARKASEEIDHYLGLTGL